MQVILAVVLISVAASLSTQPAQNGSQLRLRTISMLIEGGLAPLGFAARNDDYDRASARAKENDLGSVKVGKLSDLLILDADPLINLSNSQTIHQVMKGRRILDGPAATTPCLRNNSQHFACLEDRAR